MATEGASKRRPVWTDLPREVREAIEGMFGQRVVSAANCPGGFTPGFASRLALADGRRVFVKAMNARRWPMHAEWHRTEERIVRALPHRVPVPRFLGHLDAHGWVAVAFEDVDGHEPDQPWRPDELERVLAALTRLSRALTPSPVEVPRDHPRLGGWRVIADDARLSQRLGQVDPWSRDRLRDLVDLERNGLAAARGETLVHFDIYVHNILLTPNNVYFVDWPHARLGAPFVDLVMLLASVSSADPIDRDAIVDEHPLTADIDRHTVDGVLAAHTGFCMLGALGEPPPGLEAVRAGKLVLARAAVSWLAERL